MLPVFVVYLDKNHLQYCWNRLFVVVRDQMFHLSTGQSELLPPSRCDWLVLRLCRLDAADS